MAEVLKVSIQGLMPGGEQWSVNPCFHLLTEPAPTFTQLNTIATAINALTVPATVRALWNANTSHSGVRLEARESNGALETLVEQPRGAVVVGTGTTNHPYQTSMVFSLRTNRPGGSGRGRLYVPATGCAMVASTLRADAAVTAAALTGMKTWLSGIEAAVETVLGDTALAVWSRTTLGTFGVTRILAGDVLDVQRRRRDSLAEAYSEVSYP